MKIKSVNGNNRKHTFEVSTSRGSLLFPYSKAEPSPGSSNSITELAVDPELGREAFTYRLASGAEGTVHIEQVLDYNQDPSYLRDLLLHKLTVEARKRVNKSAISRREIIRRLGTSAAQFYRLLDPTNYRKSVDKLLLLLIVLECDIDLVIRSRSA